MNWISDNWVWIPFAIGVLVLLRRRHGRSGLGGLLGCNGHHGGHREYGDRDVGHGGQLRDEGAIDPVSGEAVRIEGALTSVFRGRVYYFQSQENRVQFEVSPERYLDAASGKALGSDHATSQRPHRRHGC